MAITFIQQKKRQKYFLIGLAVVILVICFVLWQGFFTKTTTDGPLILPAQTIDLRFDVLEGDDLDALLTPGEEVTIPQDIGKVNPFLP